MKAMDMNGYSTKLIKAKKASRSSRGDGVTGAPLLEPILRSHFALAFFARI